MEDLPHRCLTAQRQMKLYSAELESLQHIKVTGHYMIDAVLQNFKLTVLGLFLVTDFAFFFSVFFGLFWSTTML